jgi:hypothetical protein
MGLLYLYLHLHSSVGIVTRYGLGGPGSNISGGAKYYAPVHTGPGALRASYAMGTRFLSLWVKQPGHGIDHPLP